MHLSRRDFLGSGVPGLLVAGGSSGPSAVESFDGASRSSGAAGRCGTAGETGSGDGIDDVVLEETRTIPGGDSVILHAARVRLAVVRRERLYDAFDVDEDTQYVLLGTSRTPEPDDPGWGQDRFVLEVDGDRYCPLDPSVGILPQEPLAGSTAVAFPIPLDTDPDHVTVCWTGESTPDGADRWDLGSEIGRRLRDSPAFEVLSLDVPDRSEPGVLDLGFTVRNDGDRGGWFLLWLSLPAAEDVFDYHPWECVTVPVPRGETRSWQGTITWAPDPVPDREYQGEDVVGMRWPYGSTSATVCFDAALRSTVTDRRPPYESRAR